jgi:hypothetical protein
MPDGERGRPSWYVQFWWIFDALFVRPTPQIFFAWRRFALRLFGARIGKNVLIRPGVRVTYPWRLVVGNNCWIGDDAIFYTIDEITLGDHTVVSQDAYLCAGTHDPREISFPVVASPITIDKSAGSLRAHSLGRASGSGAGQSSARVPSYNRTSHQLRLSQAFRLEQSKNGRCATALKTSAILNTSPIINSQVV